MERALWLRFDTDAVVHGSVNPLLAAEIAFSCLHGNVTEKELNLFQLSTRSMAQLRARTPQIMRCYMGEPEFSCVLFYNVPEDSFRYAVAPTMAQCSSRCCKCANSRSASSRRRSPQPNSTARIA
jgi:hypothetical protein